MNTLDANKKILVTRRLVLLDIIFQNGFLIWDVQWWELITSMIITMSISNMTDWIC